MLSMIEKEDRLDQSALKGQGRLQSYEEGEAC